MEKKSLEKETFPFFHPISANNFHIFYENEKFHTNSAFASLVISFSLHIFTRNPIFHIKITFFTHFHLKNLLFYQIYVYRQPLHTKL